VKIRCGDIVFHRPTRERWLVAWAHGHELAPAGWPGCIARVKDCQVVRHCTDEEHEKEVRAWLSSKTDDSRATRVKVLYGRAILSADQKAHTAGPATRSEPESRISCAHGGRSS